MDSVKIPITKELVDAADALIEQYAPAADSTSAIQVALGNLSLWLSTDGDYPRFVEPKHGYVLRRSDPDGTVSWFVRNGPDDSGADHSTWSMDEERAKRFATRADAERDWRPRCEIVAAVAPRHSGNP